MLPTVQQSALKKECVPSLDDVVAAIKTLRLTRVGLSEAEIHDRAAAIFFEQNITVEHEFQVAPGCRLDFWVPASGIAVEFKKSRPSKASVVAQLSRYAALPEVRALVLVLECSMVLSREIAGKPLRVVSLNANWGIC
ncbi:hypothetical protein [Azospirillum sp. Marseille-Q6669]